VSPAGSKSATICPGRLTAVRRTGQGDRVLTSRIAASVTTVVLVMSAAACGADGDGELSGTGSPPGTATSTTTVPTSEPAASGTAMPLPESGISVPAGTYTKPDFSPEVTFHLEVGWTSAHDIPGFFDVQQDMDTPDVIAVQFARVVGFSTAAEAAASFATADHVVPGPVESIALAGRPCLRVLVETDDPPGTDPPVFREMLRVQAGPLSIASARRLLVHLVDTDDGVLAVLVGGSLAQWDRTMRTAQPVLDSLSIG
jgi:hypothetical protein